MCSGGFRATQPAFSGAEVQILRSESNVQVRTVLTGLRIAPESPIDGFSIRKNSWHFAFVEVER
jgi:hypothetical protein